jgi:hypothetical protein
MDISGVFFSSCTPYLRFHFYSKDLTDSGKIKKLTKSTLSAAVEIPKETRSAWEHKLELDYVRVTRVIF